MDRLIVSGVLLPIIEEPIQEGVLLLDEEQILDWGSYKEVKRCYAEKNKNSKENRVLQEEDYSDSILLPGFVNAHTHLELGTVQNSISSPFSAWLKQVVSHRKNLQKENALEYRKQVRKLVQEGIQELWNSGVVALGEISSEYESYSILSKSLFWGRVFWEYIAPSPETMTERFLDWGEKFDSEAETTRIQKGISPHSPYTVCSEALQNILPLLQKKPWAIHIAESREEELFFKEAQGELLEWILQFKGEKPSPKGLSPLSYLHHHTGLPNRPLLIHLNTVDLSDVSILEKKQPFVVHCPRSHEYFDHPPFPMKMLLENGISISIGTDSLSSNSNLNFFEELRCLKNKFPFLAEKQILYMATENGARALKLPMGIGRIQKNSVYSLLAIRTSPESFRDPYSAILNHSDRVSHIYSQNASKSSSQDNSVV